MIRKHIVLSWIIIQILFISCQNKTANKLSSNVKIAVSVDSVINSLEGAWGVDSNRVANFAIYGDSIYYPDPNLKYKFSLIKDTLIINTGNGERQKIVISYLTNDSLILYYPNAERKIIYYKRK
jgi:hypothetical protein